MLMGLVSVTSCYGVEKTFARATKYHKTDRNCDSNTKRGITSTAIRLGDSCDNTIGMVAVDPQKVPYGSLIYSPQAKRFFLACDVGGDVSARTAAKNLARKKGLSNKYRNAQVLDFYAPREIIDNHFDYFYIVKHEGVNFRFGLKESQQKLRLKPSFWIDRVSKLYDTSDEEDKVILREMKSRLQKMAKQKRHP